MNKIEKVSKIILVITDKAAAWLNLNFVKAVSYINKGKVVVAPEGPPLVISHIISNTLKERRVPTKPNTNKTCFKIGKVIYQNSLKKFVPSIFDAS